jgi:WLM domain
MYVVYLTIVVLLLLYFIPSTVVVRDGVAMAETLDGAPRTWNVVGGYDNSHAAAQKLSRLNARLMGFLASLQYKYGAAPQNRESRIVEAILVNYNPDKFYENDPKAGKGTSFTINKGEKIYICLRQKDNPMTFVDDNTVIFVMLHEISHIGNYDGWGHRVDFWDVFKFVLKEAVEHGVYRYVNYDRWPAEYCGITINYNPFSPGA